MTMQFPAAYPIMVFVLNGTLTAPDPINVSASISANFSEPIRPEPAGSGCSFTCEIENELLDQLRRLEAERLMPPIGALLRMAAVSPPPQAWFDEELDD
jgi:hypothetical protein